MWKIEDDLLVNKYSEYPFHDTWANRLPDAANPEDVPISWTLDYNSRNTLKSICYINSPNLVDDGIVIGDNCFQPVNLNSTDVSFEEADKYCRDTLNGTLAELDSEEEKEKVSSTHSVERPV